MSSSQPKEINYEGKSLHKQRGLAYNDAQFVRIYFDLCHCYQFFVSGHGWSSQATRGNSLIHECGRWYLPVPLYYWNGGKNCFSRFHLQQRILSERRLEHPWFCDHRIRLHVYVPSGFRCKSECLKIFQSYQTFENYIICTRLKSYRIFTY